MPDDAGETKPAIKTIWHRVPSIFTDGALASSRASGIHRIVMGEITFNPEEDADVPISRPVFNLVMTTEALRNFVQYLRTLEGVENPDAAE